MVGMQFMYMFVAHKYVMTGVHTNLKDEESDYDNEGKNW